MAIRKKLTHDQKTREKIQTSQIINRLVNHIDGTVEMKSTQIRAAEILLNKTLPNLQATTIAGDQDNPLLLSSEHIVHWNLKK